MSDGRNVPSFIPAASGPKRNDFFLRVAAKTVEMFHQVRFFFLKDKLGPRKQSPSDRHTGLSNADPSSYGLNLGFVSRSSHFVTFFYSILRISREQHYKKWG